MKKIDLIIQIEKMDKLQRICEELKIKEIIFSEIKLFNPELTVTKNYRGAQYQISYLSKLKAEMVVEEDTVSQINKLEELLEKEKGDSLVIYNIERTI